MPMKKNQSTNTIKVIYTYYEIVCFFIYFWLWFAHFLDLVLMLNQQVFL